MRRLRPGNDETATHAPIGTPGKRLATLAVMEMKSDCRMMTHVSGSPVTNNKMAPTKPDPSSLQYSQFTALMFLSLGPLARSERSPTRPSDGLDCGEDQY